MTIARNISRPPIRQVDSPHANGPQEIEGLDVVCVQSNVIQCGVRLLIARNRSLRRRCRYPIIALNRPACGPRSRRPRWRVALNPVRPSLVGVAVDEKRTQSARLQVVDRS